MMEAKLIDPNLDHLRDTSSLVTIKVMGLAYHTNTSLYSLVFAQMRAQVCTGICSTHFSPITFRKRKSYGTKLCGDKYHIRTVKQSIILLIHPPPRRNRKVDVSIDTKALPTQGATRMHDEEGAAAPREHVHRFLGTWL